MKFLVILLPFANNSAQKSIFMETDFKKEFIGLFFGQSLSLQSDWKLDGVHSAITLHPWIKDNTVDESYTIYSFLLCNNGNRNLDKTSLHLRQAKIILAFLSTNWPKIPLVR